MSYHPALPGLLTPEQPALPFESPQPGSEKQIRYAEALARQSGTRLPRDIASDRKKLSDWIDRNKVKASTGHFSNYPSSRQVAFAERIARIRRREIPQECFRDKGLMSGWIDSNKPR
ncbi:hypothetical protein [uncultured Roseobacter sp.]|uniref:hypothetical protein n=1 Tax=uncultured Roseobacter sp. TaxID=114847 RepID=UPI002627A137|nr:hypothetical protein [uncultured Roseobacter sp.]